MINPAAVTLLVGVFTFCGYGLFMDYLAVHRFCNMDSSGHLSWFDEGQFTKV